MATDYGNKSIVTDGLVFALDPANKQSWTGPNSSNVYDIIGTNTGTIYGGTSGSYGEFNSLDFDGVDDYMDLGTAVNLSTNSTVLFWIKREDTSAGNDVALGQSTYSWGYLMSIISGGPNTESYVRIGSNYVVFDNDSLNLPTGEWSQIGFTRTDTTFKLYQNGVEKDEKTNESISGDTLFDRLFRAGQYISNPAYYLNGELSNLLGYNRTLSASEVLQNYNTLKGRFGL